MVESERCAPVIAIAGLKGGVGRTATAVNLAAMLALSGRRTLLLDLDPKGDATTGTGVPKSSGAGDVHALSDPARLIEAVKPVKETEGLDVWPGGPMLESLEALLWARGPENRDRLLRAGLADARRIYRAIVIDTPTTLGPIGRNGALAADVILLPLAGGRFATSAVEDSISSFERVRPSDLTPLEIFGVRVGLRQEEFLLGKAPELPGEGHGNRRVLESAIAYDARTLAEASARGLPVYAHAPGSRVTRSYIELAREIAVRIVDVPRSFPRDATVVNTPAGEAKQEPSGP